MDEKELLWKKYEHDVLLHRDYLNLVLKINIFYYAVTGAIISFYFVQQDEPLIKFSLLLPFAMSVALAVFFYKAAKAADISHSNIETIAGQIGFEVFSAVGTVLAFLLRIFLLLMIVSALGILILLFQDVIVNIIECVRK
jgi:hypothetical protein